MTALEHHDFNDLLSSAIEDTIVEVLGRSVLDTLYMVLKTQYGISRDELPYRTETMYGILEYTLGVRGARTVGTHIARKFYTKLGLTFRHYDGYTLLTYILAAKSKVTSEPSQTKIYSPVKPAQ